MIFQRVALAQHWRYSLREDQPSRRQALEPIDGLTEGYAERSTSVEPIGRSPCVSLINTGNSAGRDGSATTSTHRHPGDRNRAYAREMVGWRICTRSW